MQWKQRKITKLHNKRKIHGMNIHFILATHTFSTQPHSSSWVRQLIYMLCTIRCLFSVSFQSLFDILKTDGRNRIWLSSDAGYVLSRMGEMFVLEPMVWWSHSIFLFGLVASYVFFSFIFPSFGSFNLVASFSFCWCGASWYPHDSESFAFLGQVPIVDGKVVLWECQVKLNNQDNFGILIRSLCSFSLLWHANIHVAHICMGTSLMVNEFDLKRFFVYSSILIYI